MCTKISHKSAAAVLLYFLFVCVAARQRKRVGGWQLMRCTWWTLVASICEWKHTLLFTVVFHLTSLAFEMSHLVSHYYQRWDHWHHSDCSLGNPHRNAKGNTLDVILKLWVFEVIFTSSLSKHKRWLIIHSAFRQWSFSSSSPLL